MPQLGEIKKGSEIGKSALANKFIWSACEDCGKERWLFVWWVRKHEGHNLRCRLCAHKREGVHPREERSHRWKGGRTLDKKGYVYIRLQPDDFFLPMVGKNGYVFEHRLVVAKALGRNLHTWETVHHKGTKYSSGSRENRSDNRIENLQLVSDAQNKQMKIMENKIAKQAKRIKELKRENRLLLRRNNEEANLPVFR